MKYFLFCRRARRGLRGLALLREFAAVRGYNQQHEEQGRIYLLKPEAFRPKEGK